jgi:hypothetical protein
MEKEFNFHEIDTRGNHVIRICGGDDESKQKRVNLMEASEDMYMTLKSVLAMEYDTRHHSLCYGIDIESHPDCETCKTLKMLRRVYGAIVKAEGKN